MCHLRIPYLACPSVPDGIFRIEKGDWWGLLMSADTARKLQAAIKPHRLLPLSPSPVLQDPTIQLSAQSKTAYEKVAARPWRRFVMEGIHETNSSRSQEAGS